jgi:hypothetical protein
MKNTMYYHIKYHVSFSNDTGIFSEKHMQE